MATKADGDALSRLGQETFTETFGSRYSAEDLSLFLEKNHARDVYEDFLKTPDSRAWIAEADDGRPVGFATICPCGLPVPEMKPNSGELQRFYLLDPYHGRGIGSQMLTLALEWASARFDHLYLSVFSENHGAMRLYERFGFVKIHQYHYMVGNHADPEFIMERRP